MLIFAKSAHINLHMKASEIHFGTKTTEIDIANIYKKDFYDIK